MNELQKVRDAQVEHQVMHRRLMRAATQFASPEELSEATGGALSPAEAYLYVDNFLKTRAGTWDEVQQRQLVIYRLIDFMDTLLEDVEAGSPQARNTYLSAIRTHLDALDAHQITLADLNTKLTNDQANFFVQALLEAFKYMSDEFGERGIVLADEDKQEVLEGAARVGLDKLSEYTLEVVEEEA